MSRRPLCHRPLSRAPLSRGPLGGLRPARVIAALLLVASVLTACANPDVTEAAGDSTVTLRIGDQTGETQSRLEAAGLLDDLPYRIEWSQFPAAVNLHEALRADAIDIGSAADSPSVAAIAGGSKIKIAAAWNNGGVGTFLIVPEGSPIKRLEDLKGKRISPSTRGSVAHYLVLGALEKADLTPEDVKLNFLNPADAGAAFSSGGLDAWATWGIFAAQARGELGGRVLINGEGINSGLSVMNATDKALADPAKVKAIADFAGRVDRSYVWARKDPKAFTDWYAQFAKQPAQVAAAIQPEAAAYRRVPLDDTLGDELQRTYDTWKRAGLFKRDLDLAGHMADDPALGVP